MTDRGDCLFQSFLDGAQAKVRAKFIKLLDILSVYGPNLPRPYADMLRDDIRELRIRLSTNRYRALYFFTHRNYIIITHGILKNTDEVPPNEIDRAVRYKIDFENRLAKGEIKL